MRNCSFAELFLCGIVIDPLPRSIGTLLYAILKTRCSCCFRRFWATMTRRTAKYTAEQTPAMRTPAARTPRTISHQTARVRQPRFVSVGACVANDVAFEGCLVTMVAGGCIRCDVGFLLSGTTCRRCDATCKTCNAPAACLSYGDDRFLTPSGQRKRKKETVGCAVAVSSDGCARCAAGFFRKDRECFQ